MITSSGQTVAFSNRLTSPRLLVSVRSSAEAVQALAGGAEILDVKEPEHGSLGMASVDVINDIAELVRQGISDGTGNPADKSSPILSVALGELTEWMGSREFPSLPVQVTFAKLGLSNLSADGEWPATWQWIRQQFDDRRNVPIKWVAVAYADVESAQSPSLDDVLTAAVNTGCAGLLIDTFSKTGRSLIDFVSTPRLKETAERCHASGLFLALAGSLTIDVLDSIREVPADIVAIRSAACRNGNRRDAIHASFVAEFRQGMR